MHACAAGGHFSTAIGNWYARLELDTVKLGFRSRESLDGETGACHVATWGTVVHLSVSRRGTDVCTAAGLFSTAIASCKERLVPNTPELELSQSLWQSTEARATSPPGLPCYTTVCQDVLHASVLLVNPSA